MSVVRFRLWAPYFGVLLLPGAGQYYQHNFFAQIAQSVEQRIENPRVPGSIPGLGTISSGVKVVVT